MPWLVMATELYAGLTLHPLLDLRQTVRILEDPDSPIFSNEHNSAEGQGTSSGSQVERGEGAAPWVAMIWNRWAIFMMHPYLVLQTTPGSLYTPGKFTDSWAAAFSLAVECMKLWPADGSASTSLWRKRDWLGWDWVTGCLQGLASIFFMHEYTWTANSQLAMVAEVCPAVLEIW